MAPVPVSSTPSLIPVLSHLHYPARPLPVLPSFLCRGCLCPKEEPQWGRLSMLLESAPQAQTHSPDFPAA